MFWLLLIILILGWALGVFAFGLGGLMHLLLVVALCALIYRLIRGEKVSG